MVDEQAVVPAAYLVLAVMELVVSFELDPVDQLKKEVTSENTIHFKILIFKISLPPRPAPIILGGGPLGGMPPGIGGGMPVGGIPRPTCIALPIPGAPADAAFMPGTRAIPTSFKKTLFSY